MQEGFVEQIVERKWAFSDVLKVILVILAAFAVASTFLVVAILRMVFPFVFAMSIYIPFIIIRQMKIEYEYSVLGGELDVDSIAGRRKRKKLMSMSVRRFSIIAPVTEKYAAEYSSDAIKNTIEACIGPNSEGLWFLRFEDDGGRETILFFNPNEKVLRALARYVPSKIREVPQDYLEGDL